MMQSYKVNAKHDKIKVSPALTVCIEKCTIVNIQCTSVNILCFMKNIEKIKNTNNI